MKKKDYKLLKLLWAQRRRHIASMYPGMDGPSIARKFGITKGRVYQILKSER